MYSTCMQNRWGTCQSELLSGLAQVSNAESGTDKYGINRVTFIMTVFNNDLEEIEQGPDGLRRDSSL